ncbi:glycosyltransferase family 4 protein [soil metagenome]
MIILHISTRLILGGSQENTVLSCEGQARRGHRVHLAFGPIYGPEGSLLQRVAAFNQRCRAGLERTTEGAPAAPILTHVIPDLVRQIAPRRDLRARYQIMRLVRAIAPEIVHTHSSKAGILGRAAAWSVYRGAPRARPAVLHTIHGPPFMPVEGGPLRRLKIRAANAVYAVVERRAARQCHRIISVADAMTRQFLARGIGTPGLYTTVHSGMEIAPFITPAPNESRAETRRVLGLAEDAVVVVTVARLAQHKGHDDLLAALPVDELRAAGIALLWVGDGWWRGRLIEHARALGYVVRELDRAGTPGTNPAPVDAARADLVLTGLVPPERIPALLRASDILAHPSAREGLPRTVPQALLAGIPPVAYDADGTREACIDGVTGRLVAVGDSAGLQRALLELAADPARRAALAARGHAMCLERFDARVMVGALEGAYAEALRRADAARSV